MMNTLDASIERFKQGLPAIERSTQLSSDSAHTLLLIHSLTHKDVMSLLGMSFSVTEVSVLNQVTVKANEGVNARGKLSNVEMYGMMQCVSVF